jgi:hypothetical protein
MIVIFPNMGALPEYEDQHLRYLTFSPDVSSEDATAEAKRVVPVGVPFLVVDDSVLPTDKTYRNAWRADFSTPDGHGGDA